MRLAFYKGKGNYVDTAIRVFTRSIYSHVELCYKDSGWSFSSSSRDGGVRVKHIEYHKDEWDFIDLGNRVEAHSLYQIIAGTHGLKYDYLGVLLSQVLHFGKQSKNRWFCSELIGYVLGYNKAHKLSPGSLYDIESKIR